MGPAQPSANRAGLKPAYRIEAFDIDIDQRRARCPGGYFNTQCSRLEEQKRPRVSYRFEWSYHCASCPLRSDCVPAAQPHRTIVVSQYHDLLQQRRREQHSVQFKERMHQRNAIEGAISELTRAHGLRRSRYRGFAKVELQNLLIATACNIKRWLRAIVQSFPGTSSAHAFFATLRLLSTNWSRSFTICLLCHQSAATPSI